MITQLPVDAGHSQPAPSKTETLNSPPPQMRVFVSYARKDSIFVNKLHARLEDDNRLNVLRDTEDIMASEAWWNRIKNLVRSSDAVIFVLSPNWLESRISTMELEHATSLNKHIIPVILEETPVEKIPDALKKLNFIHFDKKTDFDANIQELTNAILVDIDWVREHTRLAGLAYRWQENNVAEHLLLRSIEISKAEKWLRQCLPDAPQATRAHIAYIRQSRKASHKRAGLRIFGVLALSVGIAGAYFAIEALMHLNKIEGWKRLAKLADEQSALNKPVTGALLALETFRKRPGQKYRDRVPQAEVALDRALRKIREQKVIGMSKGSINDTKL